MHLHQIWSDLAINYVARVDNVLTADRSLLAGGPNRKQTAGPGLDMIWCDKGHVTILRQSRINLATANFCQLEQTLHSPARRQHAHSLTPMDTRCDATSSARRSAVASNTSTVAAYRAARTPRRSTSNCPSAATSPLIWSWSVKPHFTSITRNCTSPSVNILYFATALSLSAVLASLTDFLVLTSVRYNTATWASASISSAAPPSRLSFLR